MMICEQCAQHTTTIVDCLALRSPASAMLVSETLTLPTFPDTCQTDAEGLETSPDMALEILTEADQMRPRGEQAR